MKNKICKKCGSNHIKKDGKMRGKQRYKCGNCGYVFQNSSRELVNTKLRDEYTSHKQTYKELGEKYKKDVRTIRKELDKTAIKKCKLEPGETVLIADTTYFGKRSKGNFFGIMVFRSYELKKNLYWKEVKRETLEDYKSGIEYLKRQGWIIKALVCDGKKGLLKLNMPVQMCIFHQKAIIRRYLTKTPKLDANKELKEIVNLIGKVKKETLKSMLEDWYCRYLNFLKEKNDKGKLIHTRTRKAYRSIKNNIDYLYIFKDFEGKIEIPSTSNSLESLFSRLKQRIRIHRGLKKERKLKLIDCFLSK